MSVQFALNLIDQTSRPAMAAASALTKVERALSSLQKVSSVSLSKPLGAISSGFTRAGGAISTVVTSTQSLGANLASAVSKTAGAAGLLASAMAPVALGAAGLVAAGAAYAGYLASFRENAMFSFTAVMGSQQKAAEIMTMADEMARSMGVRTVSVTENLRELMASGFDVGDAKAIVSAQMDIKAINPTADLSGMNKALAKMQGSQKFQLEQAESILGAGVDDSKFYAILQRLTGSTDRTTLFKKISAGQVSDKQGLQAMLQAVQEQAGGGPLGSAAATRATSTVGGAVENAKGMLERLFLAIDTGPLGASLAKLATTAANLFDPAQPSGQKFLGLLNQAVGLVDKVLKNITPEDITNAFSAVSSAVESVLAAVTPLLSGFQEGFKEASAAVRLISNEMGQGQGQSNGMANALKAIGSAVGWVVVGIGIAAAGFAWFVGKVAGVWAFMMSIGPSIGIALVDGITSGLDRAKAGLIERLKTMAELLPDTVRKVLGIKSPSRVMMELGGYTAEGFNAGLDRSRQPADLMAAMVEPPRVPVIAAPSVRPIGAGSGGSASRQGLNVNVTFERIEISGDVQPEQAADGFRQMFRAEIMRTFEEMALESGAGALVP